MVRQGDTLNELPKRVRISSARRTRNAGISGRVVLVLVGVITTIVVVHQVRKPQPSLAPPASAAPPAESPASDNDVRPTPPPSPTSVTTVERSSDWVVLAAPSPTPTTWPTTPPRPRRQPTPTPSLSQCVVVRWSARQSRAAWGNVLVDIHAINRCGRKLEPHQIAIWIAGYRDGAVVQTASGTAFDMVYPGRSTNFAIGLPGSIDWYDRITVEVMD
jgi:hypothetical protein